MKYAKFISETQIDRNVPKKAVYEGEAYYGDLSQVPGCLESLGFLPLDEQEPPEPRPGCHVETRYALADGRIAQSWVQVEDPKFPRSLSKRKLYRALAAEGVWPAVKGYMEEAGCWEDFQLATTLDEDDPLIQDAVVALKASLGLTDEKVEALLAASVAE